MATAATPTQLAREIKRLCTERQEHVDAIAELDAIFEEQGMPIEPARRRRRQAGRPRGTVTKNGAKKDKKTRSRKSAKKQTGRSSKFTVSGETDVVNFVKRRNKPTTAQINAYWKKQGRGGTADNTLTRLVKRGELKRERIDGERGSRYVAR